MMQKKGAGSRWGAPAGRGNFGEKNDPPARRQAWGAPLKSVIGRKSIAGFYWTLWGLKAPDFGCPKAGGVGAVHGGSPMEKKAK